LLNNKKFIIDVDQKHALLFETNDYYDYFSNNISKKIIKKLKINYNKLTYYCQYTFIIVSVKILNDDCDIEKYAIIEVTSDKLSPNGIKYCESENYLGECAVSTNHSTLNELFFNIVTKCDENLINIISSIKDKEKDNIKVSFF